MSSIAFVRCQSSRRNRQIQARPRPTTRIDRNSQPPSRATSGRALRRPYSSMTSSCSSVTLSPRRTIASFSATWTVCGSTCAAACSRAASVRSSLKNELATISGSMIVAASIRWASVRPPAIWPLRRARASSTSDSRSSVRSVASRTRDASARTAAHSSEVSPRSVSRTSAGIPSSAVARRRVALLRRRSSRRMPGRRAARAGRRGGAGPRRS